MVFAEKSPIVEIKSMIEAVIVVLAVYWDLNYKYCVHLSKVLQFLQIYVLEVEPKCKVYDSVTELSININSGNQPISP